MDVPLGWFILLVNVMYDSSLSHVYSRIIRPRFLLLNILWFFLLNIHSILYFIFTHSILYLHVIYSCYLSWPSCLMIYTWRYKWQCRSPCRGGWGHRESSTASCMDPWRCLLDIHLLRVRVRHMVPCLLARMAKCLFNFIWCCVVKLKLLPLLLLLYS